MKFIGVHTHRYGDSTYYVESDRNLVITPEEDLVDLASEFGCDLEPDKGESLQFFEFTEESFVRIP